MYLSSFRSKAPIKEWVRYRYLSTYSLSKFLSHRSSFFSLFCLDDRKNWPQEWTKISISKDVPPPFRGQYSTGFLPVRTVPVLGLVLHVLLGLEPRTALPGTRAGGTSTVPVLAVLYLKWRISLILINLRFIFFESHLLLVNSYQYWWLSYLIMLLKVQDNGFLQELYLLIYQIKRKIYHIKV